MALLVAALTPTDTVSPSAKPNNGKREASLDGEELEDLALALEDLDGQPEDQLVADAESGVALTDTGGSAGIAGTAAQKKVKKKRSTDLPWVAYLLKRVPFNKKLLSGPSKAAVNNLDEFPEEMWECLCSDLYTGTGTHVSHLLINKDRPYHQNVVDHFKLSHAKVYEYMTAVEVRGEQPEAAVAAGLKMLREQQKKTGGSQSVLSKMMRKKSEMPASSDQLLLRERKELALALWMLGTQTPISRLGHKSWPDLQKELNISLHSAKELRRVHYPLIFEAILRLRREVYVSAGFIHTEFDFLTVYNKSILIVCGHTCVGFKLLSDILGIVEYTGFAGAEHVAQLASETVSRVAPNSVTLATNTVDGALRAASVEYIGLDDTEWCISHQFALPIKKSLNLTKYPDGVVALDFAFMHSFGVFVRSKSNVHEKLDLIQTKRLGPKSERKLLLDCLARWESENRKIKRFMELQEDLVILAKDPIVAAELALMKEMKTAPLDAFKPKFWSRLEAMQPVITLLHQVSKMSQSTSSVTVSVIPYWIHQVKTALVRIEDEPKAVSAWKDTMLQLTEDQFGDMTKVATNMWASAVLDPRVADLSLFGVPENVQDEVWEMIFEEHINFKTRRLQIKNNDDSLTMREEHVNLDRARLRLLRTDMLKIGKENGGKLMAGQAKIGDMNPLEFWRERSERGRDDDDFSHFAVFSATACMLLSAPGTTAESERGVGRLRRTATSYRSMLSEGMLEQEVICSHFINGSHYNFDKVLAKVAQIQQELQKK